MKKVKRIISFIMTIIVLIIFAIVYNKYNFNDFDKSVREHGVTKFTRDSKVKYSDMMSYKIENTDYSDAMFSQTISVIPNTAYKVTCMVKVENIENKNNTNSGGAHICLLNTSEKSRMINGTSDWQEVSLMFNSKNETELKIGFRLGGNEETSKGSAWFSDFKLENGSARSNNKWKMGCFIFPNIDVNVKIDEKMENVKLKMTSSEISTVQTNLTRFKTSIQELSKNKMTIDYDTYIIDEPIKTISYDSENGFYVAPDDVYNYINSYVEQNEYDHIYVAFRMADKQNGDSVLTSDWIGLGGMDYSGIGFSNIRMPDDKNNLVYTFDYRINTFPEEVFIHEFLHTLERNAQEYKYERPELHNYADYGYSEDKLEGLKKWYADYMNKDIDYKGNKIGLPKEIYSCKPVHESNFKYSIKLQAFKEPSNPIEVIGSIFRRLGKLFSYIGNKQNDI